MPPASSRWSSRPWRSAPLRGLAYGRGCAEPGSVRESRRRAAARQRRARAPPERARARDAPRPRLLARERRRGGSAAHLRRGRPLHSRRRLYGRRARADGDGVHRRWPRRAQGQGAVLPFALAIGSPFRPLVGFFVADTPRHRRRPRRAGHGRGILGLSFALPTATSIIASRGSLPSGPRATTTPSVGAPTPVAARSVGRIASAAVLDDLGRAVHVRDVGRVTSSASARAAARCASRRPATRSRSAARAGSSPAVACADWRTPPWAVAPGAACKSPLRHTPRARASRPPDPAERVTSRCSRSQT